MYDGMFPEMFPLYSSPLRLKITYLKKLEHELEKPWLKPRQKIFLSTLRWGYFVIIQARAGDYKGLCKPQNLQKCHLVLWMSLCSMAFAWMITKYVCSTWAVSWADSSSDAALFQRTYKNINWFHHFRYGT